jgi:predicted SnoaL-like aldol condensation-catalyzing enzyme
MADAAADNVELIRRAMAEIFDGPLDRRLAAAERYWAADVIDHNPDEDQAPGRQGILDVVAWVPANLPELRVAIVDAMASGDLVATREMWTTARKRREVFHWFRIRDGQVAEEWSGDRVDWEADPEPAAEAAPQ